jgi:hypothetical protein
MNIPISNPGSPAAIAAGCLCPISMNNQGNGVSTNTPNLRRFIHINNCPLHGTYIPPHTTTTIDSSGVQR